MEIDLTTPGLLFPAISLLLLAYTNRFVVLANIVRGLHEKFRENQDPVLLRQIDNLRKRIRLIRDMQALGVISLLLCTLCMFLLFLGQVMAGQIVFGLGITAMAGSLLLSLWEIQVSVVALDLHLCALEDQSNSTNPTPSESKLS